MIWIGDISSEDVDVLRLHVEEMDRVLEFGVGMSTQVIRHYSNAEFISVETSQEWIDRTKENLRLLGIREDVDFRDYYTFEPDGKYDVIFDDGATEFRLPFALKTWDHLKDNGYLLIHDCRTSREVNVIAEFIKLKSAEIAMIEFSFMDSNICVISKCPAKHYVNWNELPWMGYEKKPDWACGYADVNIKELNKLLENDRL